LTVSGLFALLLQAANPSNTSENGEAAIEATETAIASGALDQTGFFDLILDSSPLAGVVLAVLLVFSILSWTIALSKYSLLKTARRNDTKFLSAFRRINQLSEMNAASEQYRPAPLVTVFEFGYEEVARQVNNLGRLRNAASLERCLQLGINEELTHLQRNMGWLATTASATPFIGLFGTVWGVLDAFQGLGEAGGATLRAVAPGIAEALIATAFGLFAAIPALIFYNVFSQRIREIGARMDDFGLEFFNLAERSYGETDGVFEPERATTGLDR
jgi:biopolymer transport protein TolQ